MFAHKNFLWKHPETSTLESEKQLKPKLNKFDHTKSDLDELKIVGKITTSTM
jgi:hypothetical protein